MSESELLDDDFILHTNYTRDKFKLLTNTKNGSSKRIAVYEPNRQFVRVYEETSKEHHFRCTECHSKKQEIKATFSKDGQMFKVFEPFSHVCSPLRYSDIAVVGNTLEDVPMDEQPEDEPMPSTSELSSSEEEEVNVSVIRRKGKKKNNVKKKKYFDNKWKELDSSKFEFGHTSRNIPKTRLMVFESENPDEIRIYGINATKTHYKCLKCNKAKAFVEENAVIVLRDHSCPFDSYAKVNAEQEVRIVHPENINVSIHGKKSKNKKVTETDEWKEMDSSKFEFGHTSRNIPKTRLMVFESENPDEIRIYYNNNTKADYKCLKCNEAKAFVEGNAVIVLRDHSCSFDSYAEAKAVQEPITENQIRIVHPEEYEYGMNKKGEEKKRLIIFEPNDRSHARYYGYEHHKQIFKCLKCRPKHVAAKVLKDENGNEYVEISKDHVCKPLPYKNSMRTFAADEQPRDEPMSSSAEEDNINVSIHGKKGKNKEVAKINKWKKLDSSKFEFGHTSRNIPKTRLMVFESENPDEIRIYYNNNTKADYKCLKCNEAKAFVEENAVIVLRDHSCSFDSYAEAKAVQERITENRIRIVYPEEYEYGMNNKGEEKKRLIIFEPNDRSHARDYSYVSRRRVFKCLKCCPKGVFAKVLKDENGNEYVKIYKDHFCKPRPYKNAVATVAADEQPRDEPMSSSAEKENINVSIHGKKGKNKKVTETDEWKELDSSKFEYGQTSRNIPKSRILVFESENPDEIRIYDINLKKTHYKCLKCDKGKAFVKNDTVKVLQNHSCPFESYAKLKAEQEIRIVHPEEYEYGMNKKRGAKKRLIIFEPNDRSLARDYIYDYPKRAYLCLKCRPKVVVAKVLKDKNGNEYVKISRAHFCNPRPYKNAVATVAADEQPLDEPMSLSAEKENINVNIHGKKGKNKKVTETDEWKELDSSKFEFGHNSRKIPKSRILVFESENPDEIRIYDINLKKTHYKCLKCDKGKAFVEGNIVTVLQNHSCPFESYVKVNAEREVRIVYPEQYEYGINKKREEKKRLIIFEPNDRSHARDYGYDSQRRVYTCLKCRPKGVIAKILKDKRGHEHVEVLNAHRCKPRRYKRIKAEQNAFKDAPE